MSRKLSTAFIDALETDFAKHGAKAVRQLREENLRAYLMIAARFMPKPKEVPESEAPIVRLLEMARKGELNLPSPALFYVLEALSSHHDSMAGPRAHRLGCECGGTSNGVHSCTTLEKAFAEAKQLVKDERERVQKGKARNG